MNKIFGFVFNELEKGCTKMSKNNLDTIVMIVAFISGLAVSINHNPLIGVGLLLLVITAWNLGQKLPKMIKAKTNNR